MHAAIVADTTNSDLALIGAVVSFAFAGAIRIAHDAIDGALVAFGFALTALAFLL